MKEYINNKINEGVSIICDRYAYSGVAYSHAKGLDFDWCCQSDKGLPHPDLVLFVNTTASEIASRSGFGEERYEKEEFQDKVYNAYQKLVTLEPRWESIEGSGQSVDQIYEQIIEKVKGKLETYENDNPLITNSLFM